MVKVHLHCQLPPTVAIGRDSVFEPCKIGIFDSLLCRHKKRLQTGSTGLTSTHNLCFEQKYEKYQNFYLNFFGFFLVVRFSVFLNRRVFVMV